MVENKGRVVSERRTPWSARIDPVITERVKVTVAGLQRLDPSYTAGRFTEQALTAWCERMEAEYNDGQRWEADVPNQRLRPGRRLP